MNCGLGKIFKSEQIECEDMCGWLIPLEYTKEFEDIFLIYSEKVHNFDDYYTRVDYSIEGNNIKIFINEKQLHSYALERTK